MRRCGPERRDRGAVIVLVALMTTVLCVAAALAIDISSQVNERQQLHDTLDAAAHAGAYELPGSGSAVADAAEAAVRASVAANDPSIDVDGLDIRFYCVVSSGGSAPAAFTIPAVCDPHGLAGMRCNSKICSIPCDPRAGDTCNTVRVGDEKDVEYRFAPVIGEDEGSTGTLAASACKGPCGEIEVIPLDLVVVVDRTTSMQVGRTNHVEFVRDALNGVGSVDGMFDMLGSRHRVAVGTINKSRDLRTCESTRSPRSGEWIPVPLTDQFAPGSLLRNIVDCLPDNLTSFGGRETDFQGPMNAAARTLRLAPDHPTGLPPQRAVVFLTDGAPNIPLGNPCQAGITAADHAKEHDDVLVVTIAYRLSATNICNQDRGRYRNWQTTDVLAAMASTEGASAGASVNHCRSGNPLAENTDGDYFFCAPNPSDLAPIFQAVLAAVTSNITLLKLPD